MTSTEHRKLLFIGDSFASQQAAEMLQDALHRHQQTCGKDYRVIRAGYPGQGLVHFLPEVRRKVEEFRPEIVVHIYTDGDAVRHYSLIKRLVFPTTRRAIKGWISCMRLVKRIERVNPALGGFALQILLRTVLREVDIRKGLELDRELYREFAEFLGKRGIRYVVCLWDVQLYGLTKRFRETLDFLSRYDHALFLGSLNEHLSLFHEWEYRIPNDGHPNKLGNQIMTQYIVEKAAAARFL